MSNIIVSIYNFLWGDLITLNFKGTSIGIPLLVILLIPTGIFFTIRTKFMPIRKLPTMIRALGEKNDDKKSLSTFQTLIVSTATRVGMGNLVGVVAAISVGGAGAVFWMWVSAFLGASTAYAEGTLAQLHKKKDPFYGIHFKQEEVNVEFLSREELDILMNKEFTIKRLEQVRDIFVFCCFTALAFVDVQQLSREHLIKDNNGALWIRKARQKTNQMCNIPVLSIPQRILRKYEDNAECIKKGVLLPVISNQRMNAYRAPVKVA